METTPRYLPRLIGLSLGVILALLIWPATGWLVRSQVALFLPVPASVAPFGVTPAAGEYTRQHFPETAARHPDDYLLQFAAAVTVPPAEGPLTSEVKIGRLRELTRRFSDRPSLYAALLRFAVLEQVRVERDETYSLTGETPPAHHAASKPCNTPEQLAAFDRDAAEGERLDPDNAYFPVMRSVGLFAAHRDAEALAALQRAAEKPTWTEYYRDEVEGDWKMLEETFGTGSALPRIAYAAGILFPHYRELREVSRVAIARAVEAEQAGNVEEGLAIRDAVRQCGSLMRVQSSSAIGALIGIGMNQTSLARPGGAPPLKDAHGSSSNSLREQRLQEYVSYLERIGHAEKIGSVQAETAAGVQARTIAQFVGQSSVYDAPMHLVYFWAAGIVLLSSALWMLALGGVAALLARHRSLRTGKELPSSLQPGVAFGLLSGTLLAGVTTLPKGSPASVLALGGVLLSGVLALAFPGATGVERLRRMGAFGLCLAGTTLFCSALAWQLSGSIEPVAQYAGLMQNGGEGEARILPQIYSALAISIAAAVPLLTLLTISLLSLLWGVPLSVGVVRGVRGCAVPFACVLLLAYAALVPLTLRQESQINDGLKRIVRHEGHFMAEIAGKQWPGPTH